MMRRVVDTNIPIVANGRDTNASIQCRMAAIDFLNLLIQSGRIILDLGGEIQAEYHGYLNPQGQPGVGDLFYQTVLHSAPLRVERVDLPKDPVTGEFSDFPIDPALRGFDPSDRKFVAAARKGDTPIAIALDTGWIIYDSVLASNGITVEFICGRDPETWTTET